MGVAKTKVAAALSPPLPAEIISHLIDEYIEIKQHLAFRRFQPSELNGGRFAECAVRLLQHLHNPPYTPFGTTLGGGAADDIRRRIENNTSLHDSLRLYIPRLLVVLFDVRNRRDVGHVGGDVSPNLSDALFVSHTSDWIMTEILRVYYQCSISAAQEIANGLNETQIPIIADVDGFLRVQNTSLSPEHKALVILYYKNPAKVRDTDLQKWTGYTNTTRFKKGKLGELHADAHIHYEAGLCSLLPKGVLYVEKHIPMQLIV